jgi:uncharacterized membrane protein YeaQ/YmgE (transglycosylase-associated protein family)
MHTHDYVAAIVFGLIIGVVARLVLPGRQHIGVILTILIGMGAAVAGTWVAGHYHVSSNHFLVVSHRRYDWAVIGIQVGIAVVGVAIAQTLAHAVSNDRR